MKLNECPKCRERSLYTKVYEKVNKIMRVEFCINKGCKYRLDLPPIKMVEKGVLTS